MGVELTNDNSILLPRVEGKGEYGLEKKRWKVNELSTPFVGIHLGHYIYERKGSGKSPSLPG